MIRMSVPDTCVIDLELLSQNLVVPNHPVQPAPCAIIMYHDNAIVIVLTMVHAYRGKYACARSSADSI